MFSIETVPYRDDDLLTTFRYQEIYLLMDVKTTSGGNAEDTMTLENNININAALGGYHQTWRLFVLNNSKLIRKKLLKLIS